MHHTPIFALAISVALAGCSARSLVGAEEVPSDEILASETIEARLKTPNKDGVHRVLRMRIASNDTVILSRELVRFVNYGDPPAVTVEVERSGKLTPQGAARARRRLAALRPPLLSSDRPFAFVKDCPDMSSHPDNVLVVDFSKGEREGGLFLLERTCTSKLAAQALQLVNDVRTELPIQISFPDLSFPDLIYKE